MKELCEISTFSSWIHSVISSGRVDSRLWDRLSSVIRLNFAGNLGGIFVSTLEERFHPNFLQNLAWSQNLIYLIIGCLPCQMK
jgi:hypothetical protein